jgi:bacterioferritin-associated ferredoxin
VIVCHCNAVSDREVRAAVLEGACDVDDVTRFCGAGGDCGSCRASIEALLDVRPTRVLLTTAS